MRRGRRENAEFERQMLTFARVRADAAAAVELTDRTRAALNFGLDQFAETAGLNRENEADRG